MFQLLIMTMRLVAACLLCGWALSALDLSAADLIAELGVTPEKVTELTEKAVVWALPNIVLGSMVIVPLWCLVYMFRPPRQQRD